MSQEPKQLGFDFDADTDADAGAEPSDGLTRWHEERRLALKEMARQLGLPLDRRVEVILRGGVRLRGTLHLASEELFIEPRRDLRLELRIDRCTFLPTEIESCVRIDD
ncbi:MAG: hypothetical protein AB7O66_14195 [Limisphaerales bacterium]